MQGDVEYKRRPRSSNRRISLFDSNDTKKNHFSFDGLHYLQKHGTAMGTRMTPSYTNIFMGKLERDLLQRSPLQPFVWWRYIDDIFAVWPHGEDNLIKFINENQ